MLYIVVLWLMTPCNMVDMYLGFAKIGFIQCFSETLVCTYQTTLCHIQKDHHMKFVPELNRITNLCTIKSYGVVEVQLHTVLTLGT
jgi:hypothetical protein